MGKKVTVQDLILEKVDKLDIKMDILTTQTVPEILKAMAVVEATAKLKAKSAARFHGALWGGVTALISLASVAVAYFRK